MVRRIYTHIYIYYIYIYIYTSLGAKGLNIVHLIRSIQEFIELCIMSSSASSLFIA
jgi:hypothetical protein